MAELYLMIVLILLLMPIDNSVPCHCQCAHGTTDGDLSPLEIKNIE